MKRKLKKAERLLQKVLCMLIPVFMILPVINFGVISAYASTTRLTVAYSAETHADFEAAFGANSKDVYILTIIGDGELTSNDLAFINRELKNLISLNLTDAKFPDNKIPDGAFKDFINLQSIALPSYVTVIGKSAFENCVSLFNVGMGTGITEIGDNAFSRCQNLEMIYLPPYLARIGDNAFYGCTALKTVLAARTDGASYGAAQNAFSGVPSSCVLVMPAGVSGYGSAFSGLKTVAWNFYKTPQNIDSVAGRDINIEVDVTDNDLSPATYQWYYNGSAISGATGDTLVIKNASESFSGRYMVQATIKDTTISLSCVVTISGQAVGQTAYEKKNTAPERVKEPEKTKYDFVKVFNSRNSEIQSFDIYDLEKIWSYSSKNQIIGMNLTNRPDEYTYIFYTKRFTEIYTKHRTGTFKLDALLDIPFNFLNGVKNIDLTKDNQLRITVKSSGSQYSVYAAVTEENGKVLYDFKDARNLPGVYMYLPAGAGNFMIRIDEAAQAYPVPHTIDGNLLKFKIQNSRLYSRQTPAASNFSDIQTHWGLKDITNAAGNLIVRGYPDGTYKPEGTLTRAEFAATLTRVLYHAMIPKPEARKTYSDVKTSDWFYDDIMNADVMGLNGYVTGSEYNPNQQITREEMAYMVARAAEYAGADLSKAVLPALYYSDLNDITVRYKDDVKICTNLGLLQGEGGNFMPKKTLTRAETATVLNRLFALI